MGGGKSSSRSASREAQRAREAEEARQARVAAGTGNINRIFNNNFDNDYFNGVARSYLDFSNPQLVDQHQAANADLTYDLARTGKLDSSTRATKGAELQEIYTRSQQELADKARGLANDARGSVEDARAALISQVNATGDATGATNAALARASALSRPAGSYDTLANLFADFTGTLSNRLAQERAYAASGGASTGYSSPTIGARRGAVSVTG